MSQQANPLCYTFDYDKFLAMTDKHQENYAKLLLQVIENASRMADQEMAMVAYNAPLTNREYTHLRNLRYNEFYQSEYQRLIG